MKSEEILIAIEEQKLWKARIKATEKEIKRLTKAIKDYNDILIVMKEQFEYYSALVRDMKKSVKPHKVKDLLR